MNSVSIRNPYRISLPIGFLNNGYYSNYTLNSRGNNGYGVKVCENTDTSTINVRFDTDGSYTCVFPLKWIAIGD